MQDHQAPQMDWWNPVYKLEELETEWTKSLEPWINYLESKTDEEISKEVVRLRNQQRNLLQERRQITREKKLRAESCEPSSRPV